MRDQEDNTDATQDKGVLVVEGEQQETPIERPKSRRELAMLEIEAGVEQQRAREMGIASAAAATQDPDPGDDQLREQLSDEVITDPAGKKMRIKVDGVERDVDLDDVLRNYQKGAAADKRLEEATRLLKEAQQQQARPPEQAAPGTGADLVPEQSSVTPPEDVENQVKAALEAIYSGDQDAARDALVKALSQGRGGTAPTPVVQPIDYNEVASRVTQLRAVDTALETIRNDYPDIIANPDIELLTAIKVNAKVAEGTPRHVAMLESAKEVYASLGKATTGRQSAGQGESRDEKLKLKAARDRIPPANAAANQAQNDQLPSEPSDVIRSIAAGRMGQSLAFGGR